MSVSWRSRGPHIPLPGWPDGDIGGAAEGLAASAERGRELARLLDPETPVPGLTTGTLRPELAAIAVTTTAAGRNMTGDDFAVTASWEHFGTGAAPEEITEAFFRFPMGGRWKKGGNIGAGSAAKRSTIPPSWTGKGGVQATLRPWLRVAEPTGDAPCAPVHEPIECAEALEGQPYRNLSKQTPTRR